MLKLDLYILNPENIWLILDLYIKYIKIHYTHLILHCINTLDFSLSITIKFQYKFTNHNYWHIMYSTIYNLR